MISKSKLWLVITFLCLAVAASARGETVRVSEGKIELPTYALGEEDPNPPFPIAGRHHIYPYTMMDDLTDRLETKSYRAIFLENEYLKAIVLPELGGRLYSLYDKLNKREVFYRNHVVKYGLVALRGAWISGGVEFNFPDGHTVVTVSPVSSAFQKNRDGSTTVVVGDVDQVTGMHWEVALTLRPGEARLEQRVTLFNSTPTTNPYWFWANAAVPATEDMQFIYPMREAYPHAHYAWSYPLHDGVDYSWYKNARQPTSLFGRQVHREFFGAYYHQPDYGVVHVADFRQDPGKKVWTWGVADDGLIWTGLLTDRDGPYNEIQSGRYETQLNYEFLPPRRVESWTEYWYPVTGLGSGFVEATSQLAVNVNYAEAPGESAKSAEFVFYPTVELKGVKVRVKLAEKLLREQGPFDLQPDKALHVGTEVADLQAAKTQIAVEAVGADGAILLRWSAAEPVDGNRDFVPVAGAAQPKLKSVDQMTVEELFLHGVNQQKDGEEEAAAETFQAVLKRDPGYIPALLKMAWRAYRGADYRAAEGFVGGALARDASDPRVHYAAGVIYRASGRLSLAQDALWASVHFGGPPAPALAQLGEIAIHEKNYEHAASLLRRALNYNPDDGVAQADLAAALRLAGKPQHAGSAISIAIEKMPLLPNAVAEQWIEAQAQGVVSDLKFSRRDSQEYLDAAAWYYSLNDLNAASSILTRAQDAAPGGAVSPLVYYYQASIARRSGQAERAHALAEQAAKASVEKVFPNRRTDAEVLDEALQQNPVDAHAASLAGDFLFAHGRCDDAAHLWSQALGQGFENAVLMRNLGLYAWKVKKDLKGAAGFYASAVRLAPDEYRNYVDLDQILFLLGDTEAREKLFAGAPQSVRNRDTVLVRLALLETQLHHYDRALDLLRNHSFKPWEGGAIVREMFVLANVERGRQALAAKHPAEAEAAFRRALEYPHNLGVGKPDKPHEEEALFWLGEALAAEGKSDAARQAWSEAATEGKASEGRAGLFRGLALRRLGKTDDANQALASLSETPQGGAEESYLAGTLDLIESQNEQAKLHFQRALQLDPSLWQARIELEQLSR